MAAPTVPQQVPSRQEAARLYYGVLTITPRAGIRPAFVCYTYSPADTLLIGFQDALSVAARNWPGFTVLGSAAHPCRHSSLVLADSRESRLYGAMALIRSLPCPVCAPLPGASVYPMFHADSGHGG